MNQNKFKLIISSAYAAVASIMTVIIMTIWSELSVAFNKYITNLTGHHWISKSVASMIVFVVCFVVFYNINKNPDENSVNRAVRLVTVTALVGVVGLLAFFVSLSYFE